MALFKFTEAILNRRSIDVYNDGAMSRDFTYIDDIVESIARLIPLPPEAQTGARNKVYNIGFGSPVKLLDFVECIEDTLNIRAIKNFMPMQPGDVLNTWADTRELEQRIGFRPQITLGTGVPSFIDWYCSYYRV
jgi:UDP-glucuronate 4-epimerase